MTNDQKKVSIDAFGAALGLGFLAAVGIVYANKNNSEKAIATLIIAGGLSVFAMPFIIKKAVT